MDRMGSSCVIVLLVLLLTCHISVATIFVEAEGRLRCRCEKTVSAYLHPAKLESVMIYPAGIACPRPEIIVRIKKPQKVICIDPKMKWVQRIMKTMQNRNETSN